MQEINHELLLVHLTYRVERWNVAEKRLDIAHTLILIANIFSHLKTAIVSVVADVITGTLAYHARVSSLLKALTHLR